ncbi:hypothetical protein [Pedobacter heparinus]|uniref:hypothetical protein n=1 Tax=Pedobacter heparinus TaxID=984 RepID=UPI002931176D|nr:hypothetical protein [Pedobacter heparinus]
MNIPLQVMENLAAQLPDANQFVGTCFPVEFVYQDRYYELKFYVVSDGEFTIKRWLYNPYHVQIVIKNGSHNVIA